MHRSLYWAVWHGCPQAEELRNAQETKTHPGLCSDLQNQNQTSVVAFRPPWLIRLQLAQGWPVETAAVGTTTVSTVQFVLTELISKDKT